jgi:hypothetical protein
MRYFIANMSLLFLIWAALTALVAVCFDPRWWVYCVAVPVFFFVAGFLEERMFSGHVNRLVDRIWSRRT